uniref:BacB n=2 Tax=Bacillus TaxID=1386 RepID=A0A7D5HMX9_9BACI|nr:BacB [Bacillus sp. Xin1]
MIHNKLLIIKLTILNQFRQSMDIKSKELKKEYPYIPMKIIPIITLILCIMGLIVPLITSVILASLLIYTNDYIYSLYIYIYIYNLKNLINKFEINSGKINERISFIKYSSNKYLYNLFKIYNPINFIPIIIFLLSFLIKAILNQDIIFTFLIISCILTIYFITKRIDVFFQLLSLVNFSYISYILHSISSEIKWNNILKIDYFIKDNKNIIKLDWNQIFTYYFSSILLLSLTSLLIYKLINNINKTNKNIKKEKKMKKNLSKDILVYLNFSNSLTLNRKLSLWIPLGPMMIISIPLFINIPSQKYLFIIFMGIIVCLYTKRFMYQYTYFFHYFTNKKEKQLFKLNFKNLFNILKTKLLILLINQLTLIIYIYGLYITIFWNNIQFTDLLILTFVYIVSLTIPLSEKKFIIFDFQTLKLNKDNDYGGTMEVLYSMCLIILFFVNLGLEVNNIKFDISFLTILLPFLFLIFSVTKVYLNIKIWGIHHENN